MISSLFAKAQRGGGAALSHAAEGETESPQGEVPQDHGMDPCAHLAAPSSHLGLLPGQGPAVTGQGPLPEEVWLRIIVKFIAFAFKKDSLVAPVNNDMNAAPSPWSRSCRPGPTAVQCVS